MNKMKISHIILLSALAVSGLTACADYLDVMPDNVATIDYAFKDRTGAEKFLSTCYNYLPTIGSITADVAIIGSDENWMFEDDMNPSTGYQTKNFKAWYVKNGLQNITEPYMNFWDGSNGANASAYVGIRYCNEFLNNIDKVKVDVTDELKARWKAEVTVLKAWYHFYLMRMYGPIVLMKENLGIDASPEEVRQYRAPWDECVDYVVSLLDEAAPNLPDAIEDRANDMGHVTRAAALSIKALVLVTSASPLFNGNKEYMDVADNRGVHIFTQAYDASKWQKAADACREAINVCEAAGYELFQFDSPYKISETTKLLNTIRCVYSQRFNSEMIWTLPKRSTSEGYSYVTKPYLDPALSDRDKYPGQPQLVPTMRMVEKFYTKNGVPMDEDVDFNYAGRYDVVKSPSGENYMVQPNFSTARMHLDREPRFYANIAFDGGYWWGNGNWSDPGYNVNTKANDPSGKFSRWYYTTTGYWMKKPAHYQTVPNPSGSVTYVNYAAPVIRLSDLYLLYAEALNEANPSPTPEVYEYVDKVRNHVGLNGVVESWAEHSNVPNKPLTQAGMREIIHRERDLELCFESQHFWDVRRWKTAVTEIPGTLFGWNIEAKTTEDYYQVIPIGQLTFQTKNYLWPIKQNDLLVNTNLVQNPFWE